MRTEPKGEPGATYSLRVNWWMGNVLVSCAACGAERLITWSDDTDPSETALSVWGWVREHLDQHIAEEEQGP